MKKWLILAACVLAAVLTACSAAQQNAPTHAPTAATEPTAVTEPVLPNWRANVLRSDTFTYQETVDDWLCTQEAAQYPVFGSQYKRGQIRNITFVDSLSQAPKDAWDVSDGGNWSVMAWVEPEGAGYHLYIGADGGINADRACVDLFAGYQNVLTIDFGDAFHTEDTTDMSRMFFGCASLTELNGNYCFR